ncbi:hypothetical protein ACTPD5_20760, partial [Clostridioides difficile]
FLTSKVYPFSLISGFNSSNNSPPGTKVAPTTIFLSSLALEHPSPPQCGKTTLIRDIVRNLSNGNEDYGFKGLKVALVDERNEIA